MSQSLYKFAQLLLPRKNHVSFRTYKTTTVSRESRKWEEIYTACPIDKAEPTFGKILIANRGEIACRVAKTADRMGLQTVGVYNEADAAAMHVDKVTESLFIPNTDGQPVCYSNIEALITACKRSGAEAVHPGYGFLSENKLFAEALLANDIVFIGPPTQALEDMGSKSRAKEIMEKANVPMIRGYHGRD